METLRNHFHRKGSNPSTVSAFWVPCLPSPRVCPAFSLWFHLRAFPLSWYHQPYSKWKINLLRCDPGLGELGVSSALAKLRS